DANGQTNASQ
ncbi:hypothetical protein CISIN_1g0162801mg, partial [Citrus sinensis]